MTNEPVIWHYGLMAERWGEHIHNAPELPYFQQAIKQYGEPALDLACGAGRLLLPLLYAGVDIDGCDISEDMLAFPRRKAAAAGFEPKLYAQPMHAFNLPRRYKTIYICDSFGLAGSREKDLETLKRCYDHLQDGGALLLNIQAEYTAADSWDLWLPDQRANLPQPWPQEGSARQAADGSENIGYFRLTSLDPLEQSYIREVRLEKRVDGRTVAVEEYALQGNMYLKNEVLLMLKVAGFRDIAVYGDYSDQPAAAESEEINFLAVK